MAILSSKVPRDQVVVVPKDLVTSEISNISIGRSLRELSIITVSATPWSQLATVWGTRLSIYLRIIVDTSAELEWSFLIEGVTLMDKGVYFCPSTALWIYRWVGIVSNVK